MRIIKKFSKYLTVILFVLISCNQNESADIDLSQRLGPDFIKIDTDSGATVFSPEKGQIILDFKHENERKYFRFQTDEVFNKESLTEESLYYLEGTLITKMDSKVLILTIDKNKIINIIDEFSENEYLLVEGYGLAYHKKLKSPPSGRLTFTLETNDDDCDAGGVGSSGCSTDDCSVDCRAGYYSCCEENNMVNDKCYCKQDKTLAGPG
ncbi:hypothetical protein [Ekhidna sp.]|uniref:hypothetical protein n=1 Tax=Ekhidna sp. TaxID=2608089 RepID=UPI0032EC3DED